MIACKIRMEINDPATWRQIAVNLAVAIGDVDVGDPPSQLLDQAAGCLRQRQVRDIEVGLHRRVIDIVEKPGHARHVVQERQLKRLKLERDLEPQVVGVFAQRPHVLDRRAHCSAGGITSFCQIYSPSTSSTFLASNR